MATNDISVAKNRLMRCRPPMLSGGCYVDPCILIHTFINMAIAGHFSSGSDSMAVSLLSTLPLSLRLIVSALYPAKHAFNSSS